MKTFALVIAALLLLGCASKPPRCDRRLTPINAAFRAGARLKVSAP